LLNYNFKQSICNHFIRGANKTVLTTTSGLNLLARLQEVSYANETDLPSQLDLCEFLMISFFLISINQPYEFICISVPMCANSALRLGGRDYQSSVSKQTGLIFVFHNYFNFFYRFC